MDKTIYDKPTMVQLESSTACDARCVFCPHPDMKRKAGRMTDSLYLKILDEAKRLDILEVVLFLNGEPFLFPRLFQWLDMLRKRGLKTAIFTNAAHMDESKSTRIAGYSDVIQVMVFSLPGFDTESYSHVCGLDFERVMGNVKGFLKQDSGIRTAGHIPLMSQTAPFRQDWLELWEPMFDSAGYTSMFNFAGRIRDPLELKESDGLSRKACPRLNHITVLWNGKVCLCCMDSEGEVILGDARTDSLKDIFYGEKARLYRQKHEDLDFDLDLCRDCNMNIY